MNDDDGKSMAHIMAERLAQSRFTEMMASAGVDPRRMSIEVLFYLPRDFLDAYAELWHRALGADDAGVDGRSAQQQEIGTTGKAQVKARENARGESYIREASGGGKKFKKYWLIRDSDLLDMKTRLDKRLRVIGREIRAELSGSDDALLSGESRPTCSRCSKIMRDDYRFCPSCGQDLRIAD